MLALILFQAGLFQAEPVDFWGTRPRAPAPAPHWSEGERPAGPAADLIENPSAENAKRYLAWQRDRLERLQQAMAALEQARKEAAPPEILCFTREDCGWCRRQETVLREMKLKVKRITPDEPGPWLEHRVTATPTIILPGRAPLRGFQSRANLEEAMR